MALKNREVLIIDDDADQRNVLSRILENAGLKVSQAQSVQQGFELARNRVPHLILVDLLMPGESGIQFLEQLRISPEISSIPTLVISAADNPNLIYQAISLGASDYLIKPIISSTLLQRLRKALKDETFKTYFFHENNCPSLTLHISGKIVRMSEAGFILEAPIKMSGTSPTCIQSPLLEQFDLNKLNLKTANLPATSTQSGNYWNHIVTLGVSESITSKIRKVIQKW